MSEIQLLIAHCMALIASGSPIELKCAPVIERQMYALVVQAVQELNDCVFSITKGEVDKNHKYCLSPSTKLKVNNVTRN